MVATHTLVFDVAGMHCEGCENRVKKALSGLVGVTRVDADHRTGRVEVDLRPVGATAAEIKSKLALMGYEVPARPTAGTSTPDPGRADTAAAPGKIEQKPFHSEKLQVKIGGMSCSFCSESIRKAYARMNGVNNVHVSLTHEEALIEFVPDQVTATELTATLRSLGYTVRDPNKVRSFEEEEREIRAERHRLLVASGFALFAFGSMVAMWFGFQRFWLPWAMGAAAFITVFAVGWPILKMAAQALRRGILNQHVLLEFGAFGGLLGGLLGVFNPAFPKADFFGVAVFVTTYHILSGYVSLLVRTRSSQAVRKLMDLQPPTARVIRDGKEAEVPIEQVHPGDRVRVRPGDNVPVDGEVVEGSSSIDESLVTGESIPVEKGVGSEVIGGSINQAGTLVIQVIRVGSETFLRQVARHVEEARALKPGIVQLVDTVLKYYVPGVLVFAAGALLFWSAGGWVLTDEPNWVRGIFAALAVLVMGYPCALGMATPLAMIRGGGMAAGKGILMRSGESFQIFREINKVVLDKTGTITKGQPQVVDLVPLNGYSARDLLQLAGSVESVSEHPLAQAILDRAAAGEVEFDPVEHFEAMAGAGAAARVNGRRVLVGSPRFVRSEGIDLSAGEEQALHLEGQGRTVVAVARGHEAVGLIAIADMLKEDASEAVSAMKKAGLQPVMITGDNQRTAKAVAAQVGIDTVLAQVLPQDKAEQVRHLQQEGYRVAMVGDGINDAPALMQADIGIAIGAGTDIAIESSDIIIMGDRLGGVMDAYHIGRNSYRKTLQNLILAFTFNGVGVPLATTGLVHPVWAMIAMLASVTAVLVNSFGGRLLPAGKGVDFE